MRKILIAMAAVIFLAACSTQDETQTRIELHIPDTDVEQASLVYQKDFIANNRATYEAELTDEIFVFEPTIPHPLMAFISAGDQRMEVYLESNKDLIIKKVDAEEQENTLIFEGSLAAENNFLRQFRNEVQSRYSDQNTFNQYREASSEEFSHYIGQMFIESTAYLDDFHRETPLSENFRNYFQTDLNYKIYSALINYPAYHAYFNQLEESPELPEDYFAFLNDALQFEDSYFQVPSFVRFLNEYQQYYLRTNEAEVPEGLSRFESSMWASDILYDGKAHYYTRAMAINSELNWGSFTVAEEAFKNFREENPHQHLNEVLTGVYENALRIAPGNEAPAFTLTNIDGEEVSLSDFAGKVVYLDFWASWCGPCMREVPHARELKKRFEGEDDLVFLYVSVDEDENAWRRTVEQQQIQGVHLNISGMRHPIAESYNVRGVPSFFIIDREGVIFDNNPSRPSGQTIDEELNAALAQDII